MYKLIFGAKRKPGMSRKDFGRYWTTVLLQDQARYRNQGGWPLIAAVCRATARPPGCWSQGCGRRPQLASAVERADPLWIRNPTVVRDKKYREAARALAEKLATEDGAQHAADEI